MTEKTLELIKNKMVQEDVDRVKSDWQLKRGTKEAAILEVSVSNRWGVKKSRFKPGEQVNISVLFEARKEIASPHFGIAIFRHDYIYCYGPNTMFDGVDIERLTSGKGSFSIKYEEFLLLPGEYYISIAIWDPDENRPYDYHCGCYKFDIIGKEKEVLYKEEYRYKHDMFNQKHKAVLTDGISLSLVNKYGDEKPVFETGASLNLILEYRDDDVFKKEDPISICREDGVLCFRINEFKNKAINKGNKKLRIEIPCLHLLPGRYHVYLGNRKTKEFLVRSDKRDHGIVYMPHKWSINIPKGGIS